MKLYSSFRDQFDSRQILGVALVTDGRSKMPNLTDFGRGGTPL